MDFTIFLVLFICQFLPLVVSLLSFVFYFLYFLYFLVSSSFSCWSRHFLIFKVQSSLLIHPNSGFVCRIFQRLLNDHWFFHFQGVIICCIIYDRLIVKLVENNFNWDSCWFKSSFLFCWLFVVGIWSYGGSLSGTFYSWKPPKSPT